MTKNEAKLLVVSKLTELQGCKATELAAVKEIACCGYPFIQLLDELMRENEIIEIEYVLSEMNYRIKSFLLPKGTEIHIDPTHLKSTK